MSQLFNALIVDDEPGARRLMRSLLEAHNDQVRVIGEADSGEEAVTQIGLLKPDLVFLDIQMSGMTGFDVLEQLVVQPYVIFTTAFEQYAMRAFDTLSVDYLLKPIREERLAQSMEKLRLFGRVKESIDVNALQQLIKKLQPITPAVALTIRTGDKITLVRYEEIAYLEAQDKYVCIHQMDGQKYLSDLSLNRLMEMLPANFFRIQKSYIINLDKIREMYRHLNGRYLFSMNDKTNTRLTSGRTYTEVIRQRFNL
ncbi:MAG: LytTR family DNA-binding domain-containing protein [Chitinophagaceae bacterium]